ncbi:hypothetical protein [Lacimicrobium alkaliphilum]|uniref:UDP-N-acetylglucosamine kinase n=1 Tax=Lacimicrobium alkaliphilum TaxID=1526571 RepID=A0ABQ1R4F4_9ALTE|nr:hypothetical protein [Lacimicrobium alkaliphilum]GGD57554.1 hypothetical protein GCM10011357_11210 [Lacimicrobium alkaliphilum]
MPHCWIIAGPNGAGKTTFALKLLPKVAKSNHFVNADLIAAGLSPLAPERELITASRLFFKKIEECIVSQEDFAFETTLAGRSYLKLIERLNHDNWKVTLVYLALPTVGMSINRVAERVAHGGHNIPKADIMRRFSRSLRNLLLEFSYCVDKCSCFMNSTQQPELIFEQSGKARNVVNETLYDVLLKEAGL